MFTVVLRSLSDLQELCKLGKPLAPIVLPLHGRGRWFDSSIAHCRFSLLCTIQAGSKVPELVRLSPAGEGSCVGSVEAAAGFCAAGSTVGAGCCVTAVGGVVFAAAAFAA